MAHWVEGKNVLITAAGQGIGHATAKAFGAAGAQVLATDINAQTLKQFDQNAGLRTALLDVLDDQAVKRLVEENGPFDVLVNAAGFVHAGTILDMSDDEFEFAVDINIHSMIRTIRATLPAMIERGGGVILNIASVASSVKGLPNRFAYSVTKAAVIGLTKSIAADYVKQGIRCNAICPGTVESPSLKERMSALGDYEAALAAFTDRQPMGRIGQPEEIADLAVHLANATFTTGQAYAIDGGITI